MMVLETDFQHAESIRTLVKIKISESMLPFQSEQSLDQVFKFIFDNFLALMELKFRVRPRPRRAEERIASCMNCISEIQDAQLLLERSVAKESEPCSTELEHSRIEETQATESKNLPNPVYDSQETILVGQRRWKNILACEAYKGDSLSAQTLELGMRLVRRYDPDERETEGAVHWNSMGPKLRKAFQKFGGRNLSDMDWLQYSYQGSNKMRF